MFKIIVIGIVGILSSLISGPEQISVDTINSADLIKDSYVYSAPVDMSKVDPPPVPLGDIVAGKRLDPNCPVEKQCVSLLKEKGFKIQGDAKDIISNSDVPCVGCGILLFGGRWGHVAIIEAVYQNDILILEKNYIDCGVISTRSIQIDDYRIRGYLTP